jgi:hypothetical protein
MRKDDGQQKLLAVILILLSVFIAWFFLLRPTWQEKGDLKRSLSQQERIVSEPSVWSNGLEEQAKEFSLTIVKKGPNKAVVRGSRNNVLRLASSAEKSNLSLTIAEKGKVFILKW